ERFGRSRPDRLEFVRVVAELSARDQSREEFCQWIAGLCASQFPDETPESFSIHPDLEHSLSGSYARGILRNGKTHWAILAAPEEEFSANANRCLTFGLLWLEKMRASAAKTPIKGLRLLLPPSIVPSVAHLLQSLQPNLQIEIYEYNRTREVLERVNPA